MRREDLKARAKDLERQGQHAAARDAYVTLVAQESSERAGVSWLRIADLERQLGNSSGAVTGLTSAFESFASAGLNNSALATGSRLSDLAPDSPDLLAKLADLAVRQGYARLATHWILLLVGRSSTSSLPLAARSAAQFAIAFPEERAFWQDWSSAISMASGDEAAADALRHADAAAEDLGAGMGIRSAIRAQFARLAPQPVAEADDFAAVEPPALEAELLINPGPILADEPLDEASPDSSFGRIAGFEPTLLDSWHDQEVAASVDELPLLVPEAAVPSSPAPPPTALEVQSEASDDEVDEDVVEPLPLLDPGPGLPYAGFAPHSEFIADSEPDIGLPAFDGALPILGDVLPPEIDFSAVTRELSRLIMREVERADPATHYDLGLAFKEMGLLEEALAQIGAAIKGGFRQVAGLEVVGEILVERGSHADAARVLRIAADDNSVLDRELVGVLYWLARAEEALGNRLAAARLLRRVTAVEPAFRDASERLLASPTAL